MAVAKEIRKALREEMGLNARQVGVRKEGYDAVEVRIKDPAVDYYEVQRVCNRFKKIDRCETTHEILGGGNTYVFVVNHEGVMNPEARG